MYHICLPFQKIQAWSYELKLYNLLITRLHYFNTFLLFYTTPEKKWWNKLKNWNKEAKVGTYSHDNLRVNGNGVDPEDPERGQYVPYEDVPRAELQVQ